MEKIRDLPIYWHEHLREKTAKIKENNLSGDNIVNFAFITDFHLEVNEMNSPKILTEFVKSKLIEKVFIGGDVVSGKGICTEQFLFDEINAVKDAFLQIEQNCYLMEGNHDRAYSTFAAPDYYAQNIEKGKFTQIYFAKQTKYSDRVFGKDGGYYYVDDAAKKLRYVVLNSQDVPDGHDDTGRVIYNVMSNFGFLQDQIEWFSKIALNVPDNEWTVICFSHSNKKGACAEKHVYNYDVMHGIINAFKKGARFIAKTTHENELFNVKVDVDFSGRGGIFACWIGGHCHRDEIEECDGVLNVNTTTDAAYADYFNSTWRGTTLEQAFDVFTVDLTKKTISVTRVGNGEDRTFKY